MNRYKISSLTFSLIFMCMLNSSLLGIIFPYILHESKTSFYLSLGISFIIGLFLIFIYLKIFNFLPDKDIFEKIQAIFPKWLSKIISLILMILVFFVTVIIIWRLVTFISSEFLVETPNIFIGLLIAAPLFYAMLYDFDVIGRLATFCLVVAFLLLMFNVISLFSQVDISNLKPLLNFDFNHTSKSVIVFSFVVLVPAFLTLIIPKDNIVDAHKVAKSVLIAYTLEIFSIGLIAFIIVSVLGIDIANIYTFPSYVVLKTLSVLSFIQNTENISILVWVLLMTFSGSFCLLFMKAGLKDLFNLDKKKTQIFSILFIFLPFLGVVLYMLPYEIYLNKYKYVSVPLILNISIFGMFVLIYLIGIIVNKFKKIA